MRRIIEDKEGMSRAEIEINSIKDDLYSGKIIKHSFSKNQINAFKKYEDLVNNQVLSLLDQLEEEISSFGFKLTGENWKLHDLQIWNLNKFSFRKEIKIN